MIQERSGTTKRLSLYLMYKRKQSGQGGAWTKHYKTILKSGYESEDALRAGIQQTIDGMAKFYEENHDVSGNADADDAAADDQEDGGDDGDEDGEH